jgi:predicted ATPase
MIRSLRVKNFKSLKDLSLTLGQRNVLIGPNMAGKSNIVAVFRFLRQMVVSAAGLNGLSNAVNNQGGFLELVWRGDESNVISISLEGDLQAFGGSSAQQWQYHLELLGDRFRNVMRVQNETLKIVSGPLGEYSLIRTDSGADRQLLDSSGRMISVVTDNTRSALEYEIPNWEANDFRQLFVSFQFYRFVPHSIKQVNVFTAPALLEESGANLSAWLMLLQTRHRESFDRVVSAFKDALPDVADVFTWPTEQSRVFLAFKEKHLRTAVPVWQLADGALCFLAFLSLIYAPEDYGAGIFCVEEPENHLHPKLIEHLIALHDQRLQELGQRAGQVLVTTHSPILVDKCHLEDIVVVEKQEGVTRCIRPIDKPKLRELLRREEMGLGDLVYSGVLSGE